MRGLALLPVLACAAASAQNWALMNPAYKYNYSNDGSDTISNQIFVTHIDTLGVDSLIYHLDLIAELCDTCTTSLGGPCDGCYFWVDQPQFLGRTIARNTQGWELQGRDTVMIPGDPAGIGSWSWGTAQELSATFLATGEGIVLGTADSIRSILLSNGDTVRWSKSFGLLSVPDVLTGTRHALIGVHGPELGSLIPPPRAYFDFQPGDRLEYRESGSAYDGYTNMFHQYQRFIQAHVLARQETPEGPTYDYQLYTLGWSPSYPTWILDDGQGQFQASARDQDLLVRFPLLGTYPGQLAASSCYVPWSGASVVASRHGLDNDRYTLRSRSVWGNWGFPMDMMYPYSGSTPIPDLFALEGIESDPHFVEGIGLLHVAEDPHFEGRCRLELTGYLIQGSEPWGVLHDPEGMDLVTKAGAPHALPELRLLSNVVSEDLILFASIPLVNGYRIMDSAGRCVRTGRFDGTYRPSVEVSSLPAGAYSLLIHDAGVAALSFIIIR